MLIVKLTNRKLALLIFRKNFVKKIGNNLFWKKIRLKIILFSKINFFIEFINLIGYRTKEIFSSSSTTNFFFAYIMFVVFFLLLLFFLLFKVESNVDRMMSYMDTCQFISLDFLYLMLFCLGYAEKEFSE
jgi:hypothetical protein